MSRTTAHLKEAGTLALVIAGAMLAWEVLVHAPSLKPILLPAPSGLITCFFACVSGDEYGKLSAVTVFAAAFTVRSTGTKTSPA